MSRRALPLLASLAACTEPASTPPERAAGVALSAWLVCADAPRVSWESWGQGFLIQNCQGCHAEDARDRKQWEAAGMSVEASFDTRAQAELWGPRILATVLDETMPPAAALGADLDVISQDDKIRLQWWLQCNGAGS